METGKKHLASLDSLRGIGIILIFANHFILLEPYILFAWIALWVFFSLSGFLITDGLLKMRALPVGQYFGRFYLKRAFRILPAFVVFFSLAVALYFTFPRWLAGGSSLSHYWIYLVTFTFNYLAQAPIVEASLLCQADAFAIGGCVAIFRDQLPRQSRKLLWIMTIAVIAIGLVNYFAGASAAGSYWRTLGWPLHPLVQYNYQYVWGFTVINIWAATLILACLQGTAPVILSFPPLVFLGRISYGAYLSHMPLLGVYLYYLRPINPFSVRGLAIFLIWFANVILVSWLSFRFIELPFLRIKNRLGGKPRVPIRTGSFPELVPVKRPAHE